MGERAHTAINEAGKFVGELTISQADGTPIWCQVTASLLNPENPDEGHVWLFEDVTAAEPPKKLWSKASGNSN
jgi:hypothetical protein